LAGLGKKIERLAKGLVPHGLRMSAKAAANLVGRYGHYRSAKLRRAVDRDGSPLPWYTYPALEYLRQFDFSAVDMFEYGSGQSTLFWAQRCRSVTAVEDDADWHTMVAPQLGANVTYLLEHDTERYIAALPNSGRFYDAIVIDGTKRTQCAALAAHHLKPGGFIVLDNSDWFPRAAEYLRAADLIQVDMHGFGPVNPYTWTTSLFLHRAFILPVAGERQPHYSRAAVRVVNDT